MADAPVSSRAPPGLSVVPGAIPAEHADAIEHWLESAGSDIPWERAVEGRRVAQYGCRYDYAAQGVDLTPCPPIPEMLRAWLIPHRPQFTQCIINEYAPDDAIPYHTDDALFGPDILVFILGETRPLLLRREWPMPKGVRAQSLSSGVGVEEDHLLADETTPALETRYSIDVGHRGSYEMSGETRYKWQHAIPLGRKRRVSITFRSLVPGAHVLQQRYLSLKAEIAKGRHEADALRAQAGHGMAQLRGCEEANAALMSRVARLERGVKASRAKERSWARERKELQRENNNLAQQLKVLEAEVLNFMEAKGYMEDGGSGDAEKKKKKKKKKEKKKKRKKKNRRKRGAYYSDGSDEEELEGGGEMIDRDICMICHAPQGACVHTKQAWVASDPRANPAEPDQDASSDDSDHPETAFLREGAGSGEITARTRQLIQRLGPRRRGGSAGSFGDHSAARPNSASPRSLASPDGTHSGEGGASQSEASAFSDSEAEEAAMRGGKVSTSPTPSAGQFSGEVSSLTKAVAWTGAAVSNTVGYAASLMSGFVTSRGEGADIVDSTSSEEESLSDGEETV